MSLDAPTGILLGGEKRHLTNALRVAAFVLVAVVPWASSLDRTAVWCGVAICVLSLLPGYLWCRGRAPGVPVFPVFAATHLWAFGLPILTAHPQVLAYPRAQLIDATLTVCGFILLGTVAWLICSARPVRGGTMRVLDPGEGAVLVWLPVVAAAAFHLAELADGSRVFGAFQPVVRATVFGLNTLAVFVLFLKWGGGQLPARARPLLVALLLVQLAAESASLLLIGAMTTCVIALVAFTAGRGRVPWAAFAGTALVFAFLHLGKATMRERHWVADRDLVLQPADLPAWYAEWADASVSAAGGDLAGNLLGRPRDDAVPLWWRSSTMQLLLLAQDRTPKEVPFLEGATYAVIPDLLVPRFLNPHKLRTHEGTYRLNLHYGLQSLQDTWTTTIGWGLLNEAFANFGWWGAGGLAVLLGWTYGWVARFAAPAGILSLRALFAVLVMSYAFQTEFSAGVLVSALFQSTAALVVLSWAIMRREWIIPALARRMSRYDE